MSTSPSQIKTAGLCVRKWGWEKLENRVGRSSPEAELGDAVHKRLEQYLTGRVWFKGDLPGQIADRAIPFLPPPTGRLRVERWLDRTYGGVHWRGRKDLEYRPSKLWIVHDHKTTGSMGRCLKAEALQQDCQALVYSLDTMDREHVDCVQLDWLYLHTKGPEVKRVSTEIVRSAAEEGLQPYFELARLLEQTKELYTAGHLRVLDLPVNQDACKCFGGCPYEELCELRFEERIESAELLRARGKERGPMADTKMNTDALRARLMKFQGKAAPAPTPAAAPTPSVATAPVQLELNACTPPTFPGEGALLKALEASVNLNEEPAQATEETIASISPEPLPSALPEEPPPAPVATEVKAAPPAEKKPRRKAAPMATSAGEESTAELCSSQVDGTSGFTLCINCAPLRATFTYLAEWLAPVMSALQVSQGVAHYKQCDFGKGPGHLLAMTESALAANPPKGFLVLETRTSEGSDLLSLLTSKASTVIRGI